MDKFVLEVTEFGATEFGDLSVVVGPLDADLAAPAHCLQRRRRRHHDVVSDQIRTESVEIKTLTFETIGVGAWPPMLFACLVINYAQRHSLNRL